METGNKEIMVSVVVLTYDHKNYICQALDSVLNQNVDFEYEILIGDDASDDGTSDTVLEYGRKYPKLIIPIIREKNIGATRNLTDLQKRARGKYIAYLEGDDFWCDLEKLKIQTHFMEQNEKYIACTHRCQLVKENGTACCRQFLPWITKKQEYSIRDFKGVVLPGHISTLMHRNFFATERMDYHAIIECDPLIGDRSLMLLVASKGAIRQLPQVMSCYRVAHSEDIKNATTVAYKKNENCVYDDYIYTKKLKYLSETELHVDGGFRFHYRELFASAVCRALRKPSKANWELVNMLSKENGFFDCVLHFPFIVAKKIFEKSRRG